MKTETTHCEEYHELILLADSGELTHDSRRELDMHLRDCPACAQYQNDIRRIIHDSREALPGGLPSEQTVSNIIAHAGNRHGRIIFFTQPWRAVAGIAAVLAVVMTTYIAFQTPEQRTGTSAYEAGDLHVMIALASEGESEIPASDSAGSDDAQLKELAGRLLRFQGFNTEESEDPEDITDLFLPTALQLRNTREFPEETNV